MYRARSFSSWSPLLTRAKKRPRIHTTLVNALARFAEPLESRLQLSDPTVALDPPTPIVPDPAPIWSTYIGGNATEYGNSVAVDATGNIYIAGGTESPNFASNGFNTTYAGNADAFVAKLSPDGQLLWSTYIGGSARDWANALALDPAGNVYVTGETASSTWTAATPLAASHGGSDAFLAKLSPSGQLLFSTYVGGKAQDFARGIALDTDGNILLAGTTFSSGWTSLAPYNSAGDAFLAKFSPDGQPLWSTAVGGSNLEWGYSPAVDSAGNLYLTGYTESPNWISKGFDTSYNGNGDAFVAQFSPAGQPIWSTYIGGDDAEPLGSNFAIASDSANNVYVTGWTESADWTSGGYDITFNGDYDGFLVKLSSTGQSLWSTYIGGSDRDAANGVALDPAGNVFVTGGTRSPGWTAAGFDSTYNGGNDQGWSGDAFVLKLTPDGQHTWSSYIGGPNDDWANSVVTDNAGNLVITGGTWSAGWASTGSYNTAQDAFVIKINDATSSISTPERPKLVAGPDPVVSDLRPQITGLALPLFTVKLFDRAELIGQTTAAPDGVYFFTPQSDLLPGSHEIRVRQSDQSGNTSRASEPLRILVIDPVARVLVLRGSSAPDTFNLRQQPTATSVDYFENDPPSGDPSFIVPLSRFDSVAVIGNGNSDSLTITGGSFSFNSDANNAPGSLDLTLSNAGLTFTTPQHLSSLVLTAGSTAKLALAGSNLLRVDNLTIAGGASLDITNNNLVVDTADEESAQMESMILADYILMLQQGWVSPRLTSTATGPFTGLADLPNTKGPSQGPVRTTFVGESVGTNTALVKYTWNGDANLDGIINADDYFLVDAGFITQNKGWYNGDFNYDDIINADDYFLIDSAYVGQGSPLAASKPQSVVSENVAVPQPAKKADPDGILSQLFSTEPVL